MKQRAGWRVGVGPVFVYECLISSRRWQGYALRALFLCVLLITLLVVSDAGERTYAMTTPIRTMAALGEWFFLGVVGTQLTLVLLAAPAATAGAICLDRARGTLTHMLVTDLSNAEIVLGKLASRLIPVLGLVACTLPILEILALVGGVIPDAILGAFMVTTGVAILGCSLALLLSLFAGKTHEALLGTYAVWGLWLMWRPIVGALRQWFPVWIPSPHPLADPFRLAFAPYWTPSLASWDDYAWFLGVTVGISVLLVGLAVLRVRAVVTREVVKRAKAPSFLDRMQTRLAIGRRLARPALDWNPVFWREWHRARPSRWAQAVILLYFAIAGSFSLSTVALNATQAAAWVNGFQVMIGLLLLCVSASASLAEERVRGNLDILLTTPLSTPRIVLGKWLGTFRMVPILAVLPAIVVFGFVFREPARWGDCLPIVLYVFCAGAAITSLGLAMATRFSSVGGAVAATVSVYVGVAVGWFFLVIMLRQPGGVSERLLMGSPFVWVLISTVAVVEPNIPMSIAGWANLWTVALAACAALLFLGTLLGFDRRLGRGEGSFLRLLHGNLTDRESAIWLGYLGAAVLATAVACYAGADALLGFLINGTVVSVGLFLAAVATAISCSRLVEHESRVQADWAGVSFVRVVVAKWLGQSPALVLVAFLATLVVCSRWSLESDPFSRVVSVAAYIILAGMAWCSLGMALGASLPVRSASMATAALFGLVLLPLPILAALSVETALTRTATMLNPFVTVCTLTFGITRGQTGDDYGYALAALVVYTCVTPIMLAAAAIVLERRIGRKRHSSPATAPVSAA
jgi:ABC-type transport system involved in multi-copper enzyme maturation permease subunit